jgi:hypothetical protein
MSQRLTLLIVYGGVPDMARPNYGLFEVLYRDHLSSADREPDIQMSYLHRASPFGHVWGFLYALLFIGMPPFVVCLG